MKYVLIFSFLCLASAFVVFEMASQNNGIVQPTMTDVKNVFGEELKSCCQDPLTGFYRDGFCYTGPRDYGTHIVCAQVTDAFLEYSKGKGNDLITPRPKYHFPGLKDGDSWCLCISRWLESEKVGVAPKINLQATHIKALEYTTLDLLKRYSI